MKCYSTIKKKKIKNEENPAISDNMDDFSGIMPDETSQTQKDKYWMISITCEI